METGVGESAIVTNSNYEGKLDVRVQNELLI